MLGGEHGRFCIKAGGMYSNWYCKVVFMIF
jgi:hypothetical protein